MIENMIKFEIENGEIKTCINVKGFACAESNGNRPMFCKCVKNSDIDWNDKSNWNQMIKEGYQFQIDGDEIVCPKCGRKFKIVQTYEDWIKEQRKNLHISIADEDWECGITFYRLSCIIKHDDWKSIKHLFRYYRKGWSRYSECEWVGYEPTGWLTTKGEEAEIILYKKGLIKEENLIWFEPNRNVEEFIDEVFQSLKNKEENVYDFEITDNDLEIIKQNIQHNLNGVIITGTDWSIDLDKIYDKVENKIIWAFLRTMQNI